MSRTGALAGDAALGKACARKWLFYPKRYRVGIFSRPVSFYCLYETRSVLNGVFWVLETGAQWRELPEEYPPHQTCRRRFQQWVRNGKLEQALRLLHERGRLNLQEAFVDTTFASAKKGASQSAPPAAAANAKTQDGRKLRRYRKRWKVGRLFA